MPETRRFNVLGNEPGAHTEPDVSNPTRRFALTDLDGNRVTTVPPTFMTGQKVIGRLHGRLVKAAKVWVEDNRRIEWLMWSDAQYLDCHPSLHRCKQHLFHTLYEE